MVFIAYSKSNMRGRHEMSDEGRRLLRLLLENVGESPDAELSRDENGRPYLIGKEDLDFNISHSDSFVVCALSVGDGRVGVDAEPVCPAVPPERQIRFTEKYFSLNEKKLFEKDSAAFSRIWTAKEAFLKREGTGLTVKLSEADTHSLPRSVRLEVIETDGYIVTVCLSADAELRIVKM